MTSKWERRAESLNGMARVCIVLNSFPYRHLPTQTLDWFEEPEHFFQNAFSRTN